MNYRHVYHAGNFADVFKHALMTRALLYLTHKPAPLRFIDTHAGTGCYDMTSTQAQKTGEWRGGIGQMAKVPPGPARDLLQPWLDCVGPLNAEGRPQSYPGSPIIAQKLLRAGDSLRLCELHPEDADLLDIQMGRDKRHKILAQDGYAALAGLVPPPERRGLVLIDPPFENLNEFESMTQAVLRAHARWREGIFMLWYPLKTPQSRRYGEAFVAAAIRRVLRMHFDVGAGLTEGSGLSACGIIFINPTYGLEAQARLMLPALLAALRNGPDAYFSIESLSGE